MKQTLSLILFVASLCWQCKEKQEPVPQTGVVKKINVLEFSVPGVDPKNISIGKDLIVICLPENFPAGDFIKPSVIFEAGYTSNSPILDGFHFEDQEVKLGLESTVQDKENRNFNIIVIPYKAIKLTETAKNLQLTLTPESQITAAFELKGTSATVFEGETLIYAPKIRFTNKATGEIAYELYQDPVSQPENTLTATLPATMVPGEYTAELVWGPKAEVLSSQVTIRPGAVFFKRVSLHMLESDRNFEISGYNFSPSGKYEAIIRNDFITSERIALKYEKPGALSGNLPAGIGLGNYKITFLENGKEKLPYIEKIWSGRLLGDDQLSIHKTTTQPIVRIVTQPFYLRTFETSPGLSAFYFPSVKEINRKEPLTAYSETWGATPDKMEMILVHHQSRKEYILPYSGSAYGIFDGFFMFLYYPITDDIPNGQYEVYVVRGTEKTERHSEIITIK